MITISKTSKNSESVLIYFSKEALKMFLKNEITIHVNKNGITIREATINDTKTIKINKSELGYGRSWHTFINSHDYIGEYNVEKEGDIFYLEMK